jgi:hypothetical protein
MNFDDNFRRIGSANIEHVKALAAALTEKHGIGYFIRANLVRLRTRWSGVRQNAPAFWTPKAPRRGEDRPMAI